MRRQSTAPNSRKVYVQAAVRSARGRCREISQADTPAGMGVEKIHRSTCTTFGPYTDPAVKSTSARPRRAAEAWINERGDTETLGQALFRL